MAGTGTARLVVEAAMLAERALDKIAQTMPELAGLVDEMKTKLRAGVGGALQASMQQAQGFPPMGG